MIHPNMQPAQMPVMSTFVPIPFEAMAKAGAVAQQNYDQAINVREGIEDTLGNAVGLDRVFSFNPKIGSRRALGKERVDAKVSEINGMIDELSKGTPNLLSTEYKTKLSKILRTTKEAFSSRGVLGREKANYDAYQKIMEEKSKNPQWMDDPSTAWEVEQQLKQYADSGLNEPASINSNVGYADYVDVGSAVNNLVKGARETLVRNAGYQAGPAGWLEYVKEYGLSGDRIKAIVEQKIATDPQLDNTLNRRAYQLIDMGFKGDLAEAKQALVANEVALAQNVNKGSKTVSKWFDMIGNAERNRRNPFEHPLHDTMILTDKSEIDSPEYTAVKGQLDKIGKDISTKEAALAATKKGYEKEYGKDGRKVAKYWDTREGGRIDVTDKVHAQEYEIDILKNKQDRINAAHQEVNDIVDLDSIIEEGVAELKKNRTNVGFINREMAKREAVEEQNLVFDNGNDLEFFLQSGTKEATKANRRISEILEEMNNLGEAPSPEILKKRQEYTEKYYRKLAACSNCEKNPVKDKVGKAQSMYKDLMAENHTDRGTEAIITELTDAQKGHDFIKKLGVGKKDFKNNINAVYKVNSSDPEIEEDLDNYATEKATPYGTILDPNDFNKHKVVYFVPNRDDSKAGVFYKKSTDNLDEYLIGENEDAKLGYAIAQQMNSQLHGKASLSEEPVPIHFEYDKDYAKLEFGVTIPEDVDTTFDAEVFGPNASVGGGWEVRIPDEENPGDYIYEDADNKRDAARIVSAMYTAYMRNIQDAIAREKKKQTK